MRNVIYFGVLKIGSGLVCQYVCWCRKVGQFGAQLYTHIYTHWQTPTQHVCDAQGCTLQLLHLCMQRKIARA